MKATLTLSTTNRAAADDMVCFTSEWFNDIDCEATANSRKAATTYIITITAEEDELDSLLENEIRHGSLEIIAHNFNIEYNRK